MASKFLIAEWRKLALANYAVDPKILQPYLPYKTELDTWNGKHYVSLVGFRFINVRLRQIPVPFHRHFEEVNLRFYVRYKDDSGWKRGVTFIREIVPRHALTFIANTLPLLVGDQQLRGLFRVWSRAPTLDNLQRTRIQN